MFDRCLKTVEEITQIIRNAYQDGIDRQTMVAKLDHVQQKVSHLRELLQKNNTIYHKQLKDKVKEIDRLQAREQMLQEKIIFLNDSKKPNIHVSQNDKKNHRSYSSHQYTSHLNSFEEMHSHHYAKKMEKLSEQVEKSRAQASQLSKEVECLKYQKQQLVKEKQAQWILIQSFLFHGLDSSDSDSDSDSQPEMECQEDIYQRAKQKMMEIEEQATNYLQPQQEEEEIDIETDDQCQIQQYLSQDQDEPPNPMTSIQPKQEQLSSNQQTSAYLENALEVEAKEQTGDMSVIQDLKNKEKIENICQKHQASQGGQGNEQQVEEGARQEQAGLWWWIFKKLRWKETNALRFD